MATILDMLKNRLPDEAALFAASLAVTIEEAQAEAGLDGIQEEQLSTRQKSLVADLAARALIMPAMSKYKKSLAEAEGDGAGKAVFADKLKFLQEMKSTLEASIANRRAAVSTEISATVDDGVPMVLVE